MLAIFSNPRVYNTLKFEIAYVVKRGLVSEIIHNCEAKRLPYLQACILEGLRKFPPLSQLRERIVHPGGDCIQGYYVPEATYIGINAWGTQLNLSTILVSKLDAREPPAVQKKTSLMSDMLLVSCVANSTTMST